MVDKTMDATGIIEKILADANAESDKIRTDAEQQLSLEQSRLDNYLKQYSDKTQVLAQKAADDKRAQMLAAARMANAKVQLKQKRALLDEVFAKAAQQLADLDDEQYKTLVKKLILKAVETGDEEVVVDTNEKRIDHEFIKQVNRELGPGYHGNLRLSEQRQDIGCGFILKRGKISNNVSVQVLIEEARNELEAEIAKKLFSEAV